MKTHGKACAHDGDPLVGKRRHLAFSVRDPQGRMTYPLGENAESFSIKHR